MVILHSFVQNSIALILEGLNKLGTFVTSIPNCNIPLLSGCFDIETYIPSSCKIPILEHIPVHCNIPIDYFNINIFILLCIAIVVTGIIIILTMDNNEKPKYNGPPLPPISDAPNEHAPLWVTGPNGEWIPYIDWPRIRVINPNYEPAQSAFPKQYLTPGRPSSTTDSGGNNLNDSSSTGKAGSSSTGNAGSSSGGNASSSGDNTGSSSAGNAGSSSTGNVTN